MTGKRNVTIKDVAARAGVSVGTVSRVLAKNSTVKQPLLTSVNAAIAELGFRPNLAARALRANHVNVIGLLVPDITNPFFAQLANELERAASEKGHSLILSSSRNDPAHETQQLAALLEHKPKAVLIVPAGDNHDFSTETDTPVLALDRLIPGLGSVCTNQINSAALALDHLKELGHRKILYIAGPENTTITKDRRDGFCSKIDDTLDVEIINGSFDFESGDCIARDVLSRPERPTAVAAASDQQAIGFMRAARDMGIQVPSELSVVGFDDITLASLVVPRLTTIRQPVSDIAQAAIDRLFSDTPITEHTRFMGELVARQSSAVAITG